MKIVISPDPIAMGRAAGTAAAELILGSIAAHGGAHIILATGASQFETLNHLVADKRIDWSKVTMFHLDEYIGLPPGHPASFRRYLTERFLDKVPALKEYFLIDGEADAVAECDRLNQLIAKYPIDVALVGIGENGHLAFNDPPADFETETPYLVVELDEACRRQQFGEGWFPAPGDVPRRAISMSIRQIMRSAQIVCSVPDKRKSLAVGECLEGPVGPLHPASILQTHPGCTVFLDEAAAGRLSKATAHGQVG
ncbi:MAG: glucosamine-6-phosphate deaminase [Puia sp.]|nr:glucosamine-6-phosphate deaminase [Puia sp.]